MTNSLAQKMVTRNNGAQHDVNDVSSQNGHCASQNAHDGAASGTSNEAPLLIQKRYFAVATLAKKNGKLDKQPRNPTTLKPAETNDVDTLGTYQEARDAVLSGRAKVCGPVLKRDGIICLDLDAAILDPKTNDVTPGAQRVLSLFPGALVTRSVSGRGLHIWIKAKAPAGMTGACENLWTEPNKSGQKIEILVEKFVAEHWQPFAEAGEIRPLQDALNTLYSELKRIATPAESTPKAAQNGTHSPGATSGNDARVAKILHGKLANFRAKMEAAAEGGRHDLRLDLARTLGGYLHYSVFTEDDIENVLGVNFGPNEVIARKTIRDGIIAGQSAPLHLDLAGAVPYDGGNDGTSGATEGRCATNRAPEPGTQLDDIGNGRRFVAQHGADVRFCSAWKSWLIWDERRWGADERKNVELRAKETARNIYLEAHGADEEKRAKIAKHGITSAGRARVEAMLFMARSEPGIPVLPEDFDADPWLLNCQNGTIDLRTGELHPHSRANLITKMARADYVPGATCPIFLEFLHQITAQRPALVEFIQRAFGYALTGDTREHALFILHGSGRNGKSTLLEIFSEILDDYAIQMESKTITARRQEQMANDIARLRGARFVGTSETAEGRHLDENRAKQMTGGEKLTGELKYGEPFDFMPQFKIFLATNHKPEIRGTDPGIWSRIHLIPFDVKFWDADKGETGPAHLRMDKGLPARLRAEMPGVLAWAVNGCLKWQRDGLKMPSEVRDATASYREEQDVLAGFFAECCHISPDATSTAKELFKTYCTWCEDRSEKPLNQTNLGRRLKERGFDNPRNRTGTFWCGIGLLLNTDPLLSVKGFAPVNGCEPQNDKTPICKSTDLLLGKTLHNHSQGQNPSQNNPEIREQPIVSAESEDV